MSIRLPFSMLRETGKLLYCAPERKEKQSLYEDINVSRNWNFTARLPTLSASTNILSDMKQWSGVENVSSPFQKKLCNQTSPPLTKSYLTLKQKQVLFVTPTLPLLFCPIRSCRKIHGYKTCYSWDFWGFLGYSRDWKSVYSPTSSYQIKTSSPATFQPLPLFGLFI